MRQFTLQFTATGNTVVVPQIQNNQVVLTLNANQTSITELQVTSSAGGGLPPVILNLLQGPQFFAILNAFVRALTPLVASPPLLSTQFSHTEHADFKDSGVSLFDWFTIYVSASRVVARPLEKAITVALDFAGLTQGDFNQLVDLISIRGNGIVYYRTVYQTTSLSSPPILQRVSEPVGSQIAFVLNMDVVSQIIATQVSPRIAGTKIKKIEVAGVDKMVVLNWISLGYSQFDKPLRGREDGLRLHFNVTALGFDGNGDAYIQPYLQTWDGPTNFLQPDSWRMYVALVDVDLGFWADFVLGLFEFVFHVLSFIGLFLSMWNTSFLEFASHFVQSVQNGIDQADAGNIGAGAQGQLQGSANSATLPSPWSSPLPNTTFPRWDGMMHYMSFTAESIDAGIKTWINWDDAKEQPAAVISPEAWSASDRHPIQIALKLRNDLAKMAGNNLMLSWQVTRNDTGAIVANPILRYDAGPANGPVLYHHSEELYTVNAFTVSCVATITLGSQVGEIWSGQQVLTIADILDRSHGFVEWGPHWVVFVAPDSTPDKPNYWQHIRNSRIHRTAVAARCKMLKVKAEANAVVIATRANKRNFAPLRYRDDLGFPWEDLLRHRKALCEYCFFGGPDKLAPRPQEDWYEPMPDVYGVGLGFGVKPHA